jgi:hypothetical protein
MVIRRYNARRGKRLARRKSFKARRNYRRYRRTTRRPRSRYTVKKSFKGLDARRYLDGGYPRGDSSKHRQDVAHCYTGDTADTKRYCNLQNLNGPYKYAVDNAATPFPHGFREKSIRYHQYRVNGGKIWGYFENRQQFPCWIFLKFVRVYGDGGSQNNEYETFMKLNETEMGQVNGVRRLLLPRATLDNDGTTIIPGVKSFSMRWAMKYMCLGTRANKKDMWRVFTYADTAWNTPASTCEPLQNSAGDHGQPSVYLAWAVEALKGEHVAGGGECRPDLVPNKIRIELSMRHLCQWRVPRDTDNSNTQKLTTYYLQDQETEKITDEFEENPPI